MKTRIVPNHDSDMMVAIFSVRWGPNIFSGDDCWNVAAKVTPVAAWRIWSAKPDKDVNHLPYSGALPIGIVPTPQTNVCRILNAVAVYGVRAGASICLYSKSEKRCLLDKLKCEPSLDAVTEAVEAQVKELYPDGPEDREA